MTSYVLAPFSFAIPAASKSNDTLNGFSTLNGVVGTILTIKALCADGSEGEVKVEVVG